MYSNFNDLELVRLNSLDDLGAFEEIYDRYAKKMFSYAFNVLGKKELCEDLVQNIFISLWTKRKDSKITQLSPYLFRAVKYQIFNQLRSQKITSEDVAKFNLADTAMNASKMMELDDLKRTLNDYVDTLPKRCRQIFKLSRYQNKSNKEISSELGISVQTVKNQISKALIYLRQNLHKEELLLWVIPLEPFIG